MSDYHPADMPAQLSAEATCLKLESQVTALTMRLARAYGVIGQLASRVADNYTATFGGEQIDQGLQSCRVTDDGRSVSVSTLGS